MLRRKGFTLVEILFVLVIVAGIVAYAIPAYKRSQERSRYEAAVGTLVSIGNAIESLRKDLSWKENYTFTFPTGAGSFQMPVNGTVQLGCIDTPSYFIRTAAAANQNRNFAATLFALNYLEPLASDGYNFYGINEEAGKPTVCGGNCPKPAGSKVIAPVIACMCQSSTIGKSGCFYGARMYATGLIERFKTNSCTN
ncbi:MAG: type II secretion system protein [Elusimicrobiaceae bacterium]|nr:type II secretion system protein [Elusimicrobiaceae bacterium]